jgi:uncharacterized protein YciI
VFVLELTYLVPAEEADALLEAHVAWLDRQYAAGFFLASGRKVPRDGGIILATGLDRAGAEALVASDPFVTARLCAYRVTEFTASRTAPALEPYRQSPA